MIAENVVVTLLEAPELETLKKHKKPLTPEEKAAFDQDLPSGDCATVLKAEVDGKTWYACYTHRSCHISKDLDGCAKAYPRVASTA